MVSTLALLGLLLIVGRLGAWLLMDIVRCAVELPLPFLSKVVQYMVLVPAEEKTKEAGEVLPPLLQPET